MTKHNAQNQNGAAEQPNASHADMPRGDGPRGDGRHGDESTIAESIIAEASASGGGQATGAAVTAEFDDPSGTPPVEATPEQVIAQMQQELEGERSRYTDLFDKFQRTAAEFQNTRRRQEKQMADAIDRASTQVVRKLLPVIDDLDLAFDRAPASLGEDQAAWVEGFRQIQRKLLGLLEEEGVKPISSAGEFDPTHHEAVSSEPNDGVPSGHIIATFRVGYEQRGHILRPALVRVSA